MAAHPRAALGIGAAAHLFVGARSQGARETFYPYYRVYFAQGRGVHLDRPTFEAMAGPDGALMVGSAQETTEKLMIEKEPFGANRFIGRVDLGGLPRSSVLGSMDKFASGVAPAVPSESG
ncbi:hypothetical protein [Streptomyces sp. NBC_00887]|uniref:hypothetical protein n=1 Tax=Streptomyces sp. NBC_00887 TaxID=2975859 RepID=UPI0038697F76|nr:hypothetical protein OG844_02245 [Streptomyces sp. NBC_00887]WSY36052.1 hypothetical protein OG844_43355 [Streptomyces sp. NBC_00887]